MENNESEKMVIEPTFKLLSGEELLAKRNVKLAPKTVITKKTCPDGSEDEKATLKILTDELYNELSRPRLARSKERSVGEWDEEQGAVKLIRKVGKFNAFGYSKKGNIYLEYYEAIFLLELNRLEIYYNSVMLSVEQAYLVLLGDERSKKYEKTHVYSVLSQNGYIVLAHNNSVNVTYENCVWEIFNSSLNPYHKIPEEVKTYGEFQNIAENMERTRNFFCKRDIPIDDEESDETKMDESSDCQMQELQTAKRKSNCDELIPLKKSKIINEAHSSLINLLQTEPDYTQFKEIFDKFDIIKLSDDVSNENKSLDWNNLDIDFDLYFNNAKFKKTNPGSPCLRVAIIRHDEPFPTHSQILKCCQKLKSKVPIVVCMVTESKQLQAFLYYFTQDNDCN